MKKTFRERIIEIMEEKGITQADISKATNITQSSLSDYIKGKYSPKQDKIDLIAQALHVSPAYLMGWDEEKPEPEIKDDPLMVVAAHHSDYDWSESQLKEIDRFINFVKQEKEKNK